MSTERLKHDLRRLTRPDPSAGAMPPARQPKAIPAGRALGAGPGSGAGIASPLTETDYQTRQYYATESTLASSSGLFLIRVTRLKHIELVDANDQPVVIEPAAP